MPERHREKPDRVPQGADMALMTVVDAPDRDRHDLPVAARRSEEQLRFKLKPLSPQGDIGQDFLSDEPESGLRVRNALAGD